MPSLHSRFSKGKGKENLASMHKGEGRGECLGGFRMHPAYLVFLQKLNTCESLAVKWHPIKNVCSKISAQSMFLSFLHFFFFHKQNQFIWSKVLKSPNVASPNEENNV